MYMEHYLVLDTETTNTLDCPLVYDIGFMVIDKLGNIYHKESLAIKDFFEYDELMQSAYYLDKLPKYRESIKKGDRELITLYKAKARLNQICKEYHIKKIFCHNAIFDYRALQNTQRYRTTSKSRNFFPRTITIYDTLKLSRLVLGKNENYIKFCQDNNYLTKRNQVRLTAEIIYRYISGDNNFLEEHQGLDDVKIESEILTYCLQFTDIENGKLWA